MPAKLPQTFIKQPSRTLEGLRPGSEGFISLFAVHVDLEHSVYLTAATELFSSPGHNVKVTRDERGAYHLNLLGSNHRSEPENLDMTKRYGVVVPVESLTA
jgi:hypothetical protein